MLIKTALISSAAFVSMATASTCMWTRKCYGINYGAGYVCSKEFPDGGRATGRSRACDHGFAIYDYECCGITKAVTKECKWSYCGGFTVAGQTTCDSSFGSGWKYNGVYEPSDCKFTNSRVQCCKIQSY